MSLHSLKVAWLLGFLLGIVVSCVVLRLALQAREKRTSLWLLILYVGILVFVWISVALGEINSA